MERKHIFYDTDPIGKCDCTHCGACHYLCSMRGAYFNDNRKEQYARHRHIYVFQVVFKAWVAVYLVTHTFNITMAVFDLAQYVVSGAAGVIGGNTNIDVDAALSSMQSGLDAMEIPELLLLVMETSLVSLCMKIMSVLITVILYGRMIEIYLYCSVSPIPFATMTNREWGQIGNNYLKSLFALGFQGFLIMICVGIYAVLVNSMIIADNLHSAIFSLAAYTVILCFSLFKSGALAKSIFNAH